MAVKPMRLSLVCPAFQEEDVLPLFHEELTRVADALDDYEIEILYVDDGSSDGTLACLHELSLRDERVRYLSFTRNFGKEAALLAGLEHCHGDLVITLDTDLQHPPALIPRLLAEAARGYHVVMAVREEYRPPSLIKRVMTRVFYRCLKNVSEVPIAASGSDYLLLDRHALAMILKVREKHRFLKGLIYWLGYPLGEVRFRPAERPAGATKFNFARLAALGTDCLFSFSKKPLRGATYLGLGSVAAALALSLWFVVQGFRGETLSWGLAYLLVSTHFLAGCVLGAIGLLGEYLGRVFEQVKDRPLYVLKEESRDHLDMTLQAPAAAPRRTASLMGRVG